MIVAVPKGRLFDDVKTFLESKGFKLPDKNERQYYFKNWFGDGIDLFIAKPRAIPQLLASGLCQFGFCGSDIMYDSSGVEDDKIYVHLTNISPNHAVKMVFATKSDVDLTKLNRPIICATEFPIIAANYLIGRKGLSTYILNTTGSTEGYAHIGADCIIDICETGETLKANDLEIKDTIFDCNLCFYGQYELPEIFKKLLK